MLSCLEPNSRIKSALRAAITDKLLRKKRKPYGTNDLEENWAVQSLRESQFLKERGSIMLAECLPH